MLVLSRFLERTKDKEKRDDLGIFSNAPSLNFSKICVTVLKLKIKNFLIISNTNNK